VVTDGAVRHPANPTGQDAGIPAKLCICASLKPTRGSTRMAETPDAITVEEHLFTDDGRAE
jgi:hypothetical protein